VDLSADLPPATEVVRRIGAEAERRLGTAAGLLV
jgi:hypothetical protein